MPAAVACRKRDLGSAPDMRVKQAVDEFLDVKGKAGLSAKHVGDMESRLGRFAADVTLPLGDIRAN